jgi:hypothetical protein
MAKVKFQEIIKESLHVEIIEISRQKVVFPIYYNSLKNNKERW